jgi:predicted permease
MPDGLRRAGHRFRAVIAAFRRRLSRRTVIEADFRDQIDLHLEQRCAELMAAGLTRDEARREALRRFGNVTLVREALHLEMRSPWVEAIRGDIALGLRLFRRAPRFAVAVTLTVALGVGLNVAAFAALRAVVLGDRPFPAADRIVHFWQTGVGIAPQAFGSDDVDLLAGLPVFEAFGTVREESLLVRGAGDPEYATVGQVTEGFFSVFQTRADVGQVLGAADFANESQVAVIDDRVWLTQFNRARDVIGRSIRIGEELRTVIGVMPAGFDTAFPERFSSAIWIPGRTRTNDHVLASFGRLAPGVSFGAAKQVVRDAMRPRQQQAPPLRFAGGRVIVIDGIGLERIGQSDAEAAMPGLFVFQVAAALLLLIASANLANMFLAHTQNRRREIGTRTALGAGRGRVARQLVTEAMVMATVGCVVGLLLASWALSVVAAEVGLLPRAAEPGLRAMEVLVGLGSAWLMTLLFAGLPAYSVARVDPVALMTERPAGLPGRRRAAQWVLVTAQVALSVVVLTAAGLLVGSHARVMSQPLGFEPDGLVIAELQTPASANAEDASLLANRVTVAIDEHLGSREWSIGTMPFASGTGTTNWSIGPASFEWDASVTVERRRADAAYFSTLRIPIVRGRAPIGTDDTATPAVAVVNEAFERRYGRESDLLGTTLRTERQEFVIVGIAEDVRTSRLTSQPRPAIYTVGVALSSSFAVAVRSSDVAAVGAAVGHIARALGPDTVVTRIESASARIAVTESRRQFYLTVFAAFGGLALLICGVGVFGVTSTALAFRVRDVAVRLALGADPGQVKRAVVGTGLVPVIVGLAAGLLLTWWVARVVQAVPAVQGQLYETSAHDVPTLAAAAIVLLLVGALASWLPARRVDSVSPASVLKGE